jgi:hypothetical protein
MHVVIWARQRNDVPNDRHVPASAPLSISPLKACPRKCSEQAMREFHPSQIQTLTCSLSALSDNFRDLPQSTTLLPRPMPASTSASQLMGTLATDCGVGRDMNLEHDEFATAFHHVQSTSSTFNLPSRGVDRTSAHCPIFTIHTTIHPNTSYDSIPVRPTFRDLQLWP